MIVLKTKDVVITEADACKSSVPKECCKMFSLSKIGIIEWRIQSLSLVTD